MLSVLVEGNWDDDDMREASLGGQNCLLKVVVSESNRCSLKWKTENNLLS
jgi:hypothetical protein